MKQHALLRGGAALGLTWALLTLGWLAVQASQGGGDWPTVLARPRAIEGVQGTACGLDQYDGASEAAYIWNSAGELVSANQTANGQYSATLAAGVYTVYIKSTLPAFPLSGNYLDATNPDENWSSQGYWKTGWPKFPKMTIRFIPEISTRVAELLSGGIDTAVNILPDQVPTLQKGERTKVVEVPILRINFWQFDGDGRAQASPAALKDVRVRRAFWHAIDRKAIIDNVLGGHADLVNIPVNPKQFGADPSIKGYDYDPEKAKALLKEAGFGNGFTVNLWTYTAITKQVNEAAAGYLEKVGIKAVIKDYVGRVGEMETVTHAGKTDGILNNTWGSYNIFDADAILPNYFLAPESTYRYNTDKELSDWLREARGTLDQAKRKELYAKAQKRIIENVYWLPFFTQRSIPGANKKLFYEMGADEVPRYQYATWQD